MNIYGVPSHGVNRDLRSEPGHRSRAGRDTEKFCLFRLESDVQSHPANPDTLYVTVLIVLSHLFVNLLFIIFKT